MKAKIMQFYKDKIQPRFEALKAKAVQFKQRAGEWLARYRRRLRRAAGVAALVIASAIIFYLWQCSSTFRTTVQGLAAAIRGGLAHLWALLKGNRAAEIHIPVRVIEQAPPVTQAAFAS